MRTYIFTWNPKKWVWDNIEEEIKRVNVDGRCSVRWSCGNTKSIQQGDRIFLVRLGEEPKGIMGAGFSISSPFYAKHWNGDDREILYINVEFESLLNPGKDEILGLNLLNKGILSKQIWTPQASGNQIKPELQDKLEETWFTFLTSKKIRYNPFLTPSVQDGNTYSEGTPNVVRITKYERNPHARKICLVHYGYSCFVCEFNFEEYYGKIGKDYIHVHHINQIANIGKAYKIDPIRDLRPICPNCHSMIHKNKVPLSIDQLKSRLKK